MAWYNIWKWPLEVYEDIKQWKIVREALKESEVIESFKKFKYELRVDKIGRIYTVINVPEELWPYDKADQVWPWMVDQLREIDELLLNLRLNDLVYPKVDRIEGSPAYLVVLSPSTDSFQLGKFINWLFRIGFTLFTLFIANRISVKAFHESIPHLITSLF